jgi:peptidoglycan/LPS O-acetylase OafA/YrhL
LNYRAEIDGLRAIAVVFVVLYHAKIVIFDRNWFEGGFIGVDIFFVISGYLITRIILMELEQTNSFSLIKFYERRARRIFPMLFAVISVCIPFAWQKLLPLELIDFAKSALSAIGFYSNFFFYYSTTEYGADSALLKPLLHTWSLGVEEQFYIVLPIIILFIWKFARTSLLALLVGMLLMSIQFANVMEVRNSELNFFLPFSRFWELLVGSALAFIELKYGRIKYPKLTQTMPIFGLFLIIHSAISFNTNTPHPSFQTLIPILGVALIVTFCSTEDIVGKLLSFKPIVGIGLISYSLYLWHFPIFAFGRIGSLNPSNYDKLEWILLALILSIISYFLIERTFRNRNFIKSKLFCSVVVISVFILAYVNYDFISKEGYKDRLPPILSKQNLDEEVWNIFKQNGRLCHNRTSEFCTIKNGEKLTHIYAFGDSHFSALSPQLISSIKKDFNYTEANNDGCPLILNVDRYSRDGNLESHCSSDYQILRNQMVGHKPSIIIVGGRFPVYLSSQYFDNKEGGIEGGKWSTFKSKNKIRVEEEFKNTIQQLVSKGHHVVLVYPIPEVGLNVPKFIYTTRNKSRNIFDANSKFKPLTTSFEVYKDRSASTFELFDSINSPSIYRVYPHRLFCGTPIKGRCVTHDNDDVFYADDDHPSAKGSEMIVELIMKQIEKADAHIRKN